MSTPRESVESVRSTVHWTSGINVLAGIWLILAPFALAYSDVEAALWNDIIIGVAIFVLALVRVGNPLQYEAVSWTNFILGAWLILAPFALAYTRVAAALWNDIIVGIIVLSLAAWSAVASRQYGPSEER